MSYVHTWENGQNTFFSGVLELEKPISGVQDIRRMEKMLADSVGRMTIIAFQKLEA